MFKICNFAFFLFWLGIWCGSLVWVIMGLGVGGWGGGGVSHNTGVLVVLVIPPVSTKLKGGYTGFTSFVHLRLSVRLWKNVSTLYLPQNWLDPFDICTLYQANSEGVLPVRIIAKFQIWNFWQIFGICNFDFVFLWHLIWCESLVWVYIMGGGVISECRGFSCSSWELRKQVCMYEKTKPLVRKLIACNGKWGSESLILFS